MIQKLLDNFEKLAEAPNGITKLRELILQLAVQGKLVPQEPSDEPASVLLEKIKAEKEKLLKEGKVKKQKQLPPIEVDELPCNVPQSWEWTRLGQISNDIHYGYTASADHTLKDVRLLRITDIQNNAVDWPSVPGCEITERDAKKCQLNDGDILIARTGGTIGKSYLVKKPSVKAVFASYLIRLTPNRNMFPEYVKRYVESPFYWKQLYAKSMGTGQPNVNATSLKSLLTPIPPLAEQKRIVARVDELMALCDELEQQQQKAAGGRVVLNDSAINHLLSAETPKEFNKHWQLICDNFDLLYDDPKNVNKLRQAILQLAVQGKLVKQNPNDEPASELLKKIKAEKEKLIKEGKIKKQKPLPPIESDEVQYKLPKGWKWGRLQEIFFVITDGDHLPPPKTQDGIPLLVIGNVRSGIIDFSDTRFVSQEYYDNLDPIRVPRTGDLLYTVVGSYGIPVLVETKHNFCVQRHIAILKSSSHLDIRYLYYTMMSKGVFNQATQCATGIAQKTVTLSGLRRIIASIPPLAEQKRIVGKVDKLMALCDELEQKLKQKQEQSKNLMAATVHHLLAG